MRSTTHCWRNWKQRMRPKQFAAIKATVMRGTAYRRNGDAYEKHCSRCDRWLPLDAFGVDNSRPTGKAIYCLRCAKPGSNPARRYNRRPLTLDGVRYDSFLAAARAHGVDPALIRYWRRRYPERFAADGEE